MRLEVSHHLLTVFLEHSASLLLKLRSLLSIRALLLLTIKSKPALLIKIQQLL